jgi:hypothetical protein
MGLKLKSTKSQLEMNYELSGSELKLNNYLIKGELKLNWKWGIILLQVMENIQMNELH